MTESYSRHDKKLILSISLSSNTKYNLKQNMKVSFANMHALDGYSAGCTTTFPLKSIRSRVKTQNCKSKVSSPVFFSQKRLNLVLEIQCLPPPPGFFWVFKYQSSIQPIPFLHLYMCELIAVVTNLFSPLLKCFNRQQTKECDIQKLSLSQIQLTIKKQSISPVPRR